MRKKIETVGNLFMKSPIQQLPTGPVTSFVLPAGTTIYLISEQGNYTPLLLFADTAVTPQNVPGRPDRRTTLLFADTAVKVVTPVGTEDKDAKPTHWL